MGLYKDKFRAYLFKQQDGLCYYCNGKMTFKHKKNGFPARDFASFEHLVRRQQGGRFDSQNIVLACYKCNLKANRDYQTSNKGINI